MSAVEFGIPDYPDASRPARLYQAAGPPAGVLLVLAHGAGAGHLSRWMVTTAEGLASRGVTVVTFNFPYTDAGRRLPDRTPVLESAFRRAVEAARARVPGCRIAIGGKSMGGRMATHLASADDGYDAVVAFGYPLNPPGAGTSGRRQDRASHLARLRAPLLIVQGTRDTFGGPDAIREALPAGAPVTIFPVEGGDHSLEVLKKSGRTQDEVNREVWTKVVEFLTGGSHEVLSPGADAGF